MCLWISSIYDVYMSWYWYVWFEIIYSFSLEKKRLAAQDLLVEAIGYLIIDLTF